MKRTVPVSIDSMAFRGYGVTRVDGKVLFAPFSVTGDEAWVEVVEEKKNYSLGRLQRIVKPSPWRIDPKCPFFGRCGGCQWQHIADSIQRELKKEILHEVLERLGGLKNIPAISFAPPSDHYGYRTRVQLKVQGGAMGYYQERSHRVVDIDHCPISHPLINQMIPLLRKELGSFLRVKEVEIHVSPEEGKGIFVLHPETLPQGWKPLLKTFLRSYPVLKGADVFRKGKSLISHPPSLHYTIFPDRPGGGRGIRLRASPESFFQVNLNQNRNLIETVLEFSGVKRGERVFDLFSGVGNLTLPLALGAGEIIGIEGNQRAVQDAQSNAKENGIGNCHFIHGRVEAVLNRWEREKVDLVVLDPPRTGCRGMIDGILALNPGKIVYVSCDPATFARDLRTFSEKGYPLRQLRLIDMFPQTYHMEVVGLLTP